MQTQEKLGRFGHHPDPAIDYCVEVESIGGMTYDACADQKVSALADVSKRIDRAMGFRVGGDKDAVGAKYMLRGWSPFSALSIGAKLRPPI